jgi:hypothetical protein
VTEELECMTATLPITLLQKIKACQKVVRRLAHPRYRDVEALLAVAESEVRQVIATEQAGGAQEETRSQ